MEDLPVFGQDEMTVFKGHIDRIVAEWHRVFDETESETTCRAELATERSDEIR